MKTLYSPVRDENFIFYPMHYIDDAQIVIRAPHYYNQFALIEILANALPFGYKLYVKEHPSLIGCFPFRQMRDLIKKCKNIRIINPLCHPHNLIKRAKAVATINSTTGFEAILFRKPLLVFGKAWYRDAGFSTNVYALEDLPEKIKDVLNRPTPTEGQILSFLSKLKKHSFKGDTMSLNYSEGNAKDIAVALCKVLK